MRKQAGPLAPVAQRFERPLNVPPGFWKRQLATKYLEVAARGDLKTLRQLLKAHPEFLNKRGSHNRTLLWEATRSGKTEAVQWLVEHGAEVDATGCYNSETLVQITPYCAAVYYGREEIAAYLRSKGARLDIFRAAFMGDKPRVARKLTTHPEMLDAEDPFDPIYYVPLTAFAVAGGSLGLTDFLLQRGANIAPYSAMLFQLAARASRLDLVELLAARGADMRAIDTDIYVALSDLSIMRYLLDHGVSATQRSKNGFTPLLYVARGDKSESTDKVALLLEHGALVNDAGPWGRTALHSAAVAGHIHVLKLLLEHGASITSTDEQGQTPLGLAQKAGKTAAVEILTQWSATRLQ